MGSEYNPLTRTENPGESTLIRTLSNPKLYAEATHFTQRDLEQEGIFIPDPAEGVDLEQKSIRL